MRTPNIRWFLVLGLIILVALILAKYSIGTTFKSETFPLKEKWSMRLNGNIEEISVVDDGKIVVRTSRYLYALDKVGGTILWQNPLAWQPIPNPAIGLNGVIYVSDGEGIWAFRLTDGSTIWKNPLKGNARVLYVNDDIVVAEYDQDLVLLDSKNGFLLWRKPACRAVIQSYIYNDDVFIPCKDYGLRALDIYSGEDVWKIEQEGMFDQVAYGEGVIYHASNPRSVNALDLTSKTELWVISFYHPGITQFEVENDLLLLTDSTQFCIFERADGQLRWCTENEKTQNPTVVGNSVYIFNGPQDVITALDITSGTEIGRLVLRNLNFASVQRQLIESTDNLLIFGSGYQVFAFSE